MIIDCRFSSEVDDQFIKDFVHVENEVFKNNYTIEYFTRKYIKNIYGESVLVVVYDDYNKPIAARALWRNDIEGRISYQPCDTCVVKMGRGQGVFSRMTRKALSLLSDSSSIYNFPNQNSFAGYIKLGWKELASYHLMFLTNKSYLKEHPLPIDEQYFDWWIKPTPNLYHIKRGNTYYIISPHNRKYCYTVVGVAEKKLAIQLPKLNRLGIVFFKSKHKTFYNRYFATSHVVTTNQKVTYIPTWKIDAL